jgi:hypothetical protein
MMSATLACNCFIKGGEDAARMNRGETRSIARNPIGAALLCIGLLWLALSPCAAEARLEASLGFGGATPPGRWVPLRIRGEGLPRGASVRIARLAADGRSLGVETFPALEGVGIECPAWMSGDLDAVSVRLQSGDRVLGEIRIDAKSKPFPGHVVLARGLSTRARLAIASSLMPVEPVLAVAVESSDLPSNGLDYDAISAIAIGGESLELSPAQRGALLAWLAGGGRLCAAETALAGGFLGELVPAAGKGPVPYGLGRFATLSPDRAEIPASWTEALALEPYEPSARLGAGAIARAPESGAPEGGAAGASGATRGARVAMAAAAAAWIAALVAAAALGRGKAAPLAAVAAICLAAVFAGSSALDRAMLRGASVRARALVVPGSGSAFLSLDAKAYRPSSSFEWAAIRALESPSFAYADEESGAFGEWRHSLIKAAFGLRAGDGSRLELETMLEPEEWDRLSALSSAAPLRSQRGGKQPPEAESAYPLAFAEQGEPVAWWTKAPGAPWVKLKDAPGWLKDDEGWILSLRGGKRSLPLLAGRCAAGALALDVEGSALREVDWAMPLPEGGSR